VTERLIRWLRLEDEVPDEPGATVRFEWGNLPEGDSGLWFVILAVGAVLLTSWLYRREGQASRLRKAFLGGLRLLVYAAIVLVLLEPRLAVDHERTVEGHTVLLWDTSLSMSLADKYHDEAQRRAVADAAGLADPADLAALSRHEVAWRIVSRAELPEGLAAKNTLLVYAFDSEPVRIEEALASAEPRSPEALEPRGTATDLAAAVRKALEDTGGRPVAAVVCVSDGRANKGEGRQSAINALSRRGVPFYAVGIGDPTPPKNLEVVEVNAEARVVLGDPMVVEGAVRSRGYAGRDVEVELTVARTDAGGEPELLERRVVTMPADEESLPLSFRHAPAEKGDYVFALRIPAREEEPVKDDNEQQVTVTVTDDETRVLLVSGSPGFEYHFLRQRLIRERTAVVSCWLQSADPAFPQEGDERIEALPTTLEVLQDFDIVILLDPNPSDFDAVVAEAYKQFVADYKGGLLFIPGPKYGPEFMAAPDLKPFRDLMPVVPADVIDLGGAGTERWPVAATVDGADHPASRLSPDRERCRALWARLPGFFYAYPVDREKAGATVLVRLEDPAYMTERGGLPLLAAHFFDGGPVLWMGAAETWRWRSVGERVYDHYWVGLLRYLVQGRLAGGRKRLELLTDKDQYVLGEPIRLRVHAFDRSYQPLEVESLRATATVAGEELEVELEPVSARTQPGWYQATFLPPARGVVDFAMRLPDDEPGAKPESLSVTVKLPDLEFSDPRLDAETLGGIAAATSGALVALPEVAALPERIPSEEERLVVAGAPIVLWDRWETILLVCVLFGVEWTIRKRSRMV